MKDKQILFSFFVFMLSSLLFVYSFRAQADLGSYFTVNSLLLPDGNEIDEVVINAPPKPPRGFEIDRQAVSLPMPDVASGLNILSEVPAFNWVFGCSAVSAAMIAGYYDRTGWPNMYTGPTNGGVMPLNNSSWPTWSDGYSTYPNCPLIASHKGVDGRTSTSKGSIDDYWVNYNSSAYDPYITGGWTQHTWGDAVGDYMKTSQSAYKNVDGSTKFYNWTSSPNPLTCADMVAYQIHNVDGTYGRKLFYEARGYTVPVCYNQNTDNQVAGGFSFAQFKAEIDAGRPVLLNLEGHSVVGIGYDDIGSIVYIHDTWDYLNHFMTWGGSYTGMALLSVSIVNLEPASELCYESQLTLNDDIGLGGVKFSSEIGIDTQGTVIVRSNAYVVMTAPVIQLKSGFKVESGAQLLASAQSVTCPQESSAPSS